MHSYPAADRAGRELQSMPLLAKRFARDPEAINSCLLWISDLKGIHNGFKSEVVDLQEKATDLRKLITQAYPIE